VELVSRGRGVTHGAAIESVERDGETRVGRFGRRGRNGEDDVTAVNPW
jgi:hypothetical protein